MKTVRTALLIIACLLGSLPLAGQTVAVKTNLLYDALTSFNIGFEAGLSPRWSLDVSGNYSPLSFDHNQKKFKHWMVQPEARYWFCETFNGHFLALHAQAGFFNVGGLSLGVFPAKSHSRYQGNFYGAGIGYGYQLVLNRRFNLEFEIGGGWMNARFDRYECRTCGEWQGKYTKNYFGLTKAAVSLVFLLN